MQFELRQIQSFFEADFHEDFWKFNEPNVYQIKDLRKNFPTAYHMRDSDK